MATNVRQQIDAVTEDDDTIHFVTHSLGGIIVRTIQKEDPLENIGRVVMLSPPNQGSELVDTLGDYSAFGWVNVFPGVASLIFPPIGFSYIPLLPLWMLWLGLRIRKLPAPAQI